MSETENITPSQDYLKGFNLGYELSKEKPELALSLIDKMPDSEKSEGFKDGWKQSTLEKTMEEKPKVLSKDQGKEVKDKDDRDIDQDRD
ncbi:MAG: hypothetical protein IPN13_17020 [Bacteroidetes bacterium]|jgi:hypothetical protein|nr:hypothetical protein [Bacteroidota bacterium]MBP9883839.1 hypothetical protein [Chitinophagales bacterium]